MVLSTKEQAEKRAQTLSIAATAQSDFMKSPSTKRVLALALLFAMVRGTLHELV
ncbi:MAG: hypothetical protein OJF51_002443 [Nitrospira sp.]|nr:MAG: hypothetical protein OJF51_002443 [Nitrospira sp.]